MRHLTAAQKGESGGWHYVSMSRDGGHPLGYCSEHEPHATETEARECYARYQRDNVVLDDGKWSWGDCEHQQDGARCPNPANRAARIRGDGWRVAFLCPEHMTMEHAIEALGLNGPAGDSWVS